MNAELTGGFIRDLRKEHNMTQQDLANALGVSDKAVSRWETGRGLPDIGSLEDIAGVLDVSVAELLRGERFGDTITEEEASAAASAGIDAARTFAEKKKWQNIVMGLLIGMILILFIFIRLMSPDYVKNPKGAIEIETLSDNELVAVLSEDIAGYEIDKVHNPDGGIDIIYISCYKTGLHNMTSHKEKTIVYLEDAAEGVDYIYYYPSDMYDSLIWAREGAPVPDGGTMTLPRLIYNFWLFVGIIASIVGIILCIVFRKKRAFGPILKITMIPVSLTVSLAAILVGRFNSVYNAPFYFVGIVLLAALIYLLFLIIYSSVKSRRRVNRK